LFREVLLPDVVLTSFEHYISASMALPLPFHHGIAS